MGEGCKFYGESRRDEKRNLIDSIEVSAVEIICKMATIPEFELISTEERTFSIVRFTDTSKLTTKQIFSPSRKCHWPFYDFLAVV